MKIKLTDYQISVLIHLFGIKKSRMLISFLDKPIPDRKFIWHIEESKKLDIKKLKILEVVSCSHYNGVEYLLNLFNNSEVELLEHFKDKNCGFYYIIDREISTEEYLDPDIKIKIYEKNISLEGFRYAKSMIDDYDSKWKYINILKGDS